MIQFSQIQQLSILILQFINSIDHQLDLTPISISKQLAARQRNQELQRLNINLNWTNIYILNNKKSSSSSIHELDKIIALTNFFLIRLLSQISITNSTRIKKRTKEFISSVYQKYPKWISQIFIYLFFIGTSFIMYSKSGYSYWITCHIIIRPHVALFCYVLIIIKLKKSDSDN